MDSVDALAEPPAPSGAARVARGRGGSVM